MWALYVLSRFLRDEWAVKDSNLRSLLTTDLQSVPFGHLGNRPRVLFLTFNFFALAKPTTGIELVTYALQVRCSAD